MSQAGNIATAFLQGLTGAGLFRRLDYPGAPTEFIETRSLDEICSEQDNAAMSVFSIAAEGSLGIAKPRKDARRNRDTKTGEQVRDAH